MSICKECGGSLKSAEKALNKKLINVHVKEFLCLKCMALYFDVEEEQLHEKIEFYRSIGCDLFGKKM